MRFFLRQPSAVIIISGYSFRDEHLNEIFLQGVQGNVTAVIFCPSSMETSPIIPLQWRSQRRRKISTFYAKGSYYRGGSSSVADASSWRAA